MRYNDTTVHSVPVGVNILGSILHMNALKSQNLTPYPLEANILPFPGLKPQWTYDGTSFTSILLIGLGLALIPGGFAIEVVALRQVSYILGGGGGGGMGEACVESCRSEKRRPEAGAHPTAR